MTLTLVSDGLARPESPDADATSTLSASNVQQIQETLEEILPLYRAVTKSAHKEHGHGHGKLPIVHLILIIGKVLAPLVGAIVEPLLVNIAKGITWAITYSLATGNKLYIILVYIINVSHTIIIIEFITKLSLILII